jgi:hypothetical protein
MHQYNADEPGSESEAIWRDFDSRRYQSLEDETEQNQLYKEHDDS